MKAKWIIEESTNISKIINQSENLIFEYVDEITCKNQIKEEAKFDLLKTNMLKLIELFFNLKNFNLDSKKIDSEIGALNNIISITSKLHFEDGYSTILNSFLNSYRNGDYYNDKKNDDKFLIHFTDNCDFWIFSWSEKEDLYKILDEILEDYSTEFFFDSKQNFTPEVIFDNEILSFLKYMNIDLKKIIKDKHNEEYLDYYWTIDYQIITTVGDDFLKNIKNEAHFAYDIIYNYGFDLDGDKVIFSDRIEDRWTGHDINPLDEDVDKELYKYLDNYLDEYFSDMFNEDINLLGDLFTSGEISNPKITYKYFPDIDKIIKK